MFSPSPSGLSYQSTSTVQYHELSFPRKKKADFLCSHRISPGQMRMRTAQIGATTALALHALCAAGLAVGYWFAQSFYSSSLITDPTRTLRFLTVIFSIYLFSFHPTLSYLR
jgi:hypothetical protein